MRHLRWFLALLGAELRVQFGRPGTGANFMSAIVCAIGFDSAASA